MFNGSAPPSLFWGKRTSGAGMRRTPRLFGFVLPEFFHVGDEEIEFEVVDFFVGERGHDAETLPDLEAEKGRGERFVVERGAESGFAAGMALVAMNEEDFASGGETAVL